MPLIDVVVVAASISDHRKNVIFDLRKKNELKLFGGAHSIIRVSIHFQIKLSG